ncbi:MAG: ABC transporter ATP-binding protein [Ignavibacteriales bacterium]|nr:ABC transporter ATP-binding protein [Ignavibacteriales bacterium]
MPAVITAHNVGKQYIITRRHLHNSLRDVIAEKFSRLTGRSSSANDDVLIWALDDVSFDVQQGEVLGVIGRNGAGKSTLLKIISRITEPTSGEIRFRGRVASLLEVGTGFSGELTGRENVYLNGAILGMKKNEIDRKFDEIVAFAEVEQFVDTPVKRYSSGMYMRLAFAVAAHLETEILIVDEVLAVGDSQFQEKCLRRMENISKQEGRTVLFVSHNMGTITKLCTHALYLQQGKVRALGETNSVVSQYLHSEVQEGAEKILTHQHPNILHFKEIFFNKIAVKDHQGLYSTEIDVRYPSSIVIDYTVSKPVRNIEISVRFFSYDGRPVFTCHQSDLQPDLYLQRQQGTFRAVLTLPPNILIPGEYYISLEAHEPAERVLDKHEHVIKFRVNETGSKLSRYQPHQYMHGVIMAEFPWTNERTSS